MPTISVDKAELFKALGKKYATLDMQPHHKYQTDSLQLHHARVR